ncbi:branched-chain amino acid ABC transporter permease [Nocardioides panacihumi]|uniref:Branched-chain amino acid ABC transporter permease n=1 Tax=Nocardioides panacihumi TaxID=400774 RepID=A0ABN2QV48_9ACTN
MTARTIQHGSREHRLWQALLYGGLAVLVLVIALTQPDYRMVQFSAVAAWSVALLGMNLIIGYGGQMALGHSAFFGFGAYLTAILYSDYGVSFVGTLPISAVAGAVVGLLLGLPALRISGLYLALVTLAVALAFPSVVKMDQLSALTGGANGKLAYIVWQPPSWLPFAVTSAGWVLLTISTFAAVLFLLASNAMRSRVGRAVLSLRDNAIGAAVSGVHPAVWRTSTFAVSAAYASLAGSLMMLAVPIVGPDSGGFLAAVTLITGMVIGGASTISGAVIGAVAVVWLPELSKSWAGALPLVSDSDGTVLSTAVYGAVLIVVVFVMPGGVVEFLRKARSRIAVVVPRIPTASTGLAAVPTPHTAQLEAQLEVEQP